MHTAASNRLRCVAAAALSALCFTATDLAHSANHALILWIGDYGNPSANLPGIDRDAAMARKIARSMGVPEANMREIHDAGLTKSNINAAFDGLTRRIAPGDNVFLYYSGHGGQITGGTQSRCTEGLITRDPQLYEDGLMEDQLARLGKKAGQVVFLNDSCFSGGAATRALRSTRIVPKFYPGTSKLGTVASEGYQCGNAVNKMGRNLEVVGAQPEGPRVLYVAAASATEVAGATNEGSIATLAWSSCLGTSADADRSGSINGEELRQCAQSYIDQHGGRTQTITVQGNAQLPVMFPNVASTAASNAAQDLGAVATAGAAAATSQEVAAQPAPAAAPTPAPELDPGVTQPVPDPGVAQPVPAPAPAAVVSTEIAVSGTPSVAEEPPRAVNPVSTLHDLRATGSKSYEVSLSGSSPLRIGQDFLDFSVSTNKAGYLYVLHVGSDGQTFDLLFPNKIDQDNWMEPGTIRLPRANWRVRAGGPAGTSHLLAIVSPVKKDMSKRMNLSKTFPSAKANTFSARNLVVETSDGQGVSASFGTSNILAVQER